MGRENQEEGSQARPPHAPRSWAEVHLSRPDGLVMVGWDLGIHSSPNPREDDSWVCQGKKKPPGKERGGLRGEDRSGSGGG